MHWHKVLLVLLPRLVLCLSLIISCNWSIDPRGGEYPCELSFFGSTKNAGFIFRNSSFRYSTHLQAESCTWSISVRKGKYIRLRFAWMRLKYCLDSCRTCDSITITNLSYGNGRNSLTLCTPSAPNHTLTTVSNHVSIIYKVVKRNSSQQERLGFNLTFQEVDHFEAPSDTIACRETHEILNLKRGDTGAIYSYATSRGSYRPKEHCKWHLRAEGKYDSIRFELVYIDIEDACTCYDSIAVHTKWCQRACRNDHLAIWDGDGDSESTTPLLMYRCGLSGGQLMPCTAISSSNQATVTFKTSNRGEYRGFILIYTVVEADHFPCMLFHNDWKVKLQINGTLKPSGYVATYKRFLIGRYRVHARCRWHVDFYPKVFTFKFVDFDLGEGNCEWCKGRFDRFLIDNYNITYTGDNFSLKTQYVVVKPGGDFISLDTRSSFGQPGFNFSYAAVPHSDIEQCNGPKVIDGSAKRRGNISNYIMQNGRYRTPDHCIWYIEGPKYSTISLTIRKMALDKEDGREATAEDNETCPVNYVMLYEGSTKLTSRLCGWNLPNDTRAITTSSSNATIEFVTNDTHSRYDPIGSGFLIEYQINQNPAPHFDLTICAIAISCACIGVVAAAYLAISLTRRHYRKKAERIRSTRLSDSLLGEMYVIPLPYFRKVLDEMGCKEYADVIDQLTIQNGQIRLVGDAEQVLGQGHFTSVRRGIYTTDGGTEIDVAVKLLKAPRNDDAEQLASFLREGLLMHLMDHENILKVYGIVLLNDNSNHPSIVFPYMAHGDLHTFLQSLEEKDIAKFVEQGIVLEFCRQICAGMCHFSERNCIHRDLACRNVLVRSDLCLKISDFGFARELTENDYYRMSVGRRQLVPYRWYPPEAFQPPFIFTTKSDVWSYGVVCWEIFETPYRRIPYEGKQPQQVIKSICRGEKLSRPKLCPEEIYHYVMLSCWEMDLMKRSTFQELHGKIKSLFETAGG